MPDIFADRASLAVIALHIVKMSKASSRWGLFSRVCFLMKDWWLRELHAENRFYIQISIELKIKCSRIVLNGLAWFVKPFVSYTDLDFDLRKNVESTWDSKVE